MWHTRSVEDLLIETKSSRSGLSKLEAKNRLVEHGPNVLTRQGGRSALKILVEQFTATMVLILIAAGIISILLNDTLEAIAIFFIVILFGIMGFIQENRAEKALAALKKMSVPSVRVRREGIDIEVDSATLVPGDIVLLDTGRIVPADCRLIEQWNLRVQESSLTGESEAVSKDVQTLKDDEVALGDRTNMAYLGTNVSSGRAEALVIGTGMKTELGSIAAMIQKVETEDSPLQKRLEKLGKVLAIVGVGLSILIAVLGLLAGQGLGKMLILAVSMAVAIVPEGLPAVLTITLALGARRMFARRALIRRLAAVETLGSVTIICTDKTGTLTQNKMTVVGAETINGTQDIAVADSAQSLLWALGSLCNDARHDLGDPTETCLLHWGTKIGLDYELIRKESPRLQELAFDSDRKRMSTFHTLQAKSSSPHFAALFESLGNSGAARVLMATKGSPDGLLAISTSVWDKGTIRPLTAADRTAMEATNARLASEGKRVLGFGLRMLPELPADIAPERHEQMENDLVFAGLLAIFDPPRPEVRPAIATCTLAGIRPIMITGDHPLTASAIAADLGMQQVGPAITGKELEHMNDQDLSRAVATCNVFARVSPEHKLRIVTALQAQNQIVAMTGDGVNDAPALRKANIGVAMGITGTDVAKEAGQMVLTDDNFASIVHAVEEGRVIYDNIRKYIQFSLGGNAGKVLVLLLVPIASALLAQGQLSPVIIGLTALQLLWLNLLCDGLLSIGLGVEHGEPGVMERKPVKPEASIFDRAMISYVLINGLVIGLISAAVGLIFWLNGASLSGVQTAIFMELFFVQMWSVFSVRTGSRSVFRSEMKPNLLILLMVGVSFILQIGSVTVPFLRDFLGTSALTFVEIAGLFALGALMIPVLEIQKWFRRREIRKA